MLVSKSVSFLATRAWIQFLSLAIVSLSSRVMTCSREQSLLTHFPPSLPPSLPPPSLPPSLSLSLSLSPLSLSLYYSLIYIV